MKAALPHIDWAERSGAFAGALLDPDTLIPAGIGKDAEPAPKRFSVYRNNVVVSLMEALSSTYPSMKVLLGDENFDRISRAYVAKNPPKSAMMQNYGADFASFVENLPALSELPFLSDLAKLEWAWNEAYHALDQSVLTADELAGLSPEESMELTLEAHSATSLIRSNWCVLDLFQCRFEPLDDDIDFDEPQNALVTRAGLSVTITPLSAPDAICLAALLDGQPFGAAVGAAMSESNDYNTANLVALFLQNDAFQSFIKTTT